MRPADVGWLTLWAWVFGYNVGGAETPRGDDRYEVLSEAVDRYLIARRWPTEVWLALFYLHLSNRVPDRYDPVHWVSGTARWWCERE